MNNYINDEFFLDYEGIREKILSAVSELDSIRIDPDFEQALGEKAINEIKEGEKNVRRRLEDAFNLVVIGDFKRGKSTLINALIGAEIAPVAAVHETVTINRFSYGSEFSAEAVFSNGKRIRLHAEDLRKLRLTDIQDKLKVKIDYIDIKYPCELLKSMNIIDTPGLGNFPNELDGMVVDYLLKSDAVLYVTSILAPLSASEQSFLTTAVIPQNFKTMFIALNMIDIIDDPDSIDELCRSLTDKLSGVGGDTKIYPVSSLDELCRRTDKPSPKPGASEYYAGCFRRLSDGINEDITENRELIKSTRALSLARQVLSRARDRSDKAAKAINGGLNSICDSEKRLDDDERKLLQQLDESKLKLGEAVERMKNEAVLWIDEYICRIREELNYNLKNTADMNLERYLQMYMVDMIQRGASACIDTHNSELMELYNDERLRVSEAAGEVNTKNVGLSIANSVDNSIWTKADTVYFTSCMFSSFVNTLAGQVLIGVGQVITGFVRMATIKNNKNDILKSLLANIDDLRANVKTGLVSIYDDMYKKLSESLEKYYAETIDNAREISENALRLLKKDEDGAAETVKRLSKLSERIDGLYKSLE